MSFSQRALSGLVCAVTAVSALNLAASPLTSAADHLVTGQTVIPATQTTPVQGYWANEQPFTGSIDAGLINAFVLTGNSNYLSAATAAGNFILSYESNGGNAPNFYGDEAYSLTRLANLTSNSTFATAVTNFYNSTVRGSTGSTAGYISRLESSFAPDHSQPVFYLSYHTLASFAAQNVLDKNAFRNATISELGSITNDDLFPTESVGIALWALASTGPLDSTLVNPAAAAGTFWAGVKLSDLPAIVARQQVTTGDTAGSFNFNLDDNASPYPDATENAVYATLGLLAAQQSNPALYNYTAQINLARQALANGIDASGAAHPYLNDRSNDATYTLTGEVALALPEPASLGLLSAGAMGVLGRRRRS